MLPRLHQPRRGRIFFDARVHRAGKSWPVIGQAVLCGVVLISGLSGCSTLQNAQRAITNNGAWNETVLVMRNRTYSARAWHRRKHAFKCEKYIRDFAAGFRQGYEDVANGSDGCTPAFPPQNYWSWEYQSAEGQARSAAWFSGYPHGARAAEEDGVGNWAQIQMSAACQAECQQCGLFEHEGNVYPIPGQPVQEHPLGAPYNIPGVIPEGAEIIPPQPTETDGTNPANLLIPNGQ